MCGIFGYVGKKNGLQVVFKGLKRLEYRGYDSAGIAGIQDGEIVSCKESGKITILEEKVLHKNWDLHVAIAHTRWATHGKPTKENAHPHFNSSRSLCLVHNGIIENHEPIREQLLSQGVHPVSETDTELVAHLISGYYQGDLLDAVQKTVQQLKGAYALAILHKDFPDQIMAVAHESPLVIGIGNDEAFISSDSHAFASHTREVVYLSNAEIAVIKANGLEIFDSSRVQVDIKSQLLDDGQSEVSKGDFEHYTLKEIFEQPQSVKNAMLSRFLQEYGTATFEDLGFDVNELLSVERILILACGTSWHAGYVAAYMIEDKARIPVQVEISSEFRYKNPVVPHGTLVIAISQSGETADTIAAVREIKAKGGKVIAVCNVQGSTLAREADSTITLRAGPEIGVCSTKAFTSQLVVLSLFALLMARMRHMSKQEGQHFLKEIQKLPEQIQIILNCTAQIEAVAKKYTKYENFFFLGRNYMYPASLEGALKLKEISYVNANGYPAGEMKHGPIALINENCPTVALCGNTLTLDKLLSNLMEVKSRNGPILAIAKENTIGLDKIADDIILIPDTLDELAAIPTTVVTQLLAYYIARERGAEIDQPRNLAKSVTVE